MRGLTDRLLDFARAENRDLASEFETFRTEYLTGSRARAFERCAALQARLSEHVRWEEAEVFPAFASRCHTGDELALHELARDHGLLLRMFAELAALVVASGDPTVSAAVRELFDDIDAVLYDHRLREEAEVCAPLDHVLDAPTIERIERAYTPGDESR